MYFKDFLKQYKNEKIKLFIDMDGVIVDYIFGEPRDYDKKRPLFNNINKLKAISKMPNVELFILSATRKTEGIKQKNWWLDKFAPFFKKKNRIILSREENDMTKSAVLKAEYLKNYKRDGSVLIVVDDDPMNLRKIRSKNKDIILLKDSALDD